MDALLLFIVLFFSSVSFISTTTYTCDPSISCGCSSESILVTARIIGGEPAQNHAWGWMVSFQQYDQLRCGASLITPEYAITAAHCVDGVTDSLSTLSILAGTNYLNETSSPAQRRTIIKITMNPDYDPQYATSDIAVLQFSPLTISTNSNIAFICLPDVDQDPFQTGDNLVALGWGLTSLNSTVPSNSLQQVTVLALGTTSQACENTALSDPNTQFCAGLVGGGKDTCNGDSGGPLMAFYNNRWVLAGITSFGERCAEPDQPGVYTRVSSLVPFVLATINSSASESIIVPIASTEPNDGNVANVIHKSILILMFWFSFLVISLFSY